MWADQFSLFYKYIPTYCIASLNLEAHAIELLHQLYHGTIVYVVGTAHVSQLVCR